MIITKEVVSKILNELSHEHLKILATETIFEQFGSENVLIDSINTFNDSNDEGIKFARFVLATYSKRNMAALIPFMKIASQYPGHEDFGEIVERYEIEMQLMEEAALKHSHSKASA